MRRGGRKYFFRFSQTAVGVLETGEESRHRTGADGNVLINAEESWCQPCLTLLSLLQRTADIGWMAIDKRSDLRGEIALLQCCFPNESIAGVYCASRTHHRGLE